MLTENTSIALNSQISQLCGGLQHKHGSALGFSHANIYRFEPLLEDALTLVSQRLQKFASSSTFVDSMHLVFGNNLSNSVLQSFSQEWKQSGFKDLAHIDLLTGVQLGGANAAFCGVTDSIYLSKDFLRHNANNIEAIADVLLEEYGHKIDTQLNAVDTLGDEGEHFQKVVQGESLSAVDLLALKTENDHTTITVDGKTLAVELSKVAAIAFNNRPDGATRVATKQTG